MVEFLEFLGAFLALIPKVAVAAALIAIIVDALKQFGLPDGKAGIASGVLNLAAWVGLWFADRVGSTEQVVGIIDNLTVIAPSVAALIFSLVGSKGVHWLLTELGIGYSFPARKK